MLYIVGSVATPAPRTIVVGLNLRTSCPQLPQAEHISSSRNILVLEQGVVVQGDLRAGIARPLSFKRERLDSCPLLAYSVGRMSAAI
jgi:hypothetical protein